MQDMAHSSDTTVPSGAATGMDTSDTEPSDTNTDPADADSEFILSSQMPPEKRKRKRKQKPSKKTRKRAKKPLEAKLVAKADGHVLATTKDATGFPEELDTIHGVDVDPTELGEANFHMLIHVMHLLKCRSTKGVEGDRVHDKVHIWSPKPDDLFDERRAFQEFVRSCDRYKIVHVDTESTLEYPAEPVRHQRNAKKPKAWQYNQKHMRRAGGRKVNKKKFLHLGNMDGDVFVFWFEDMKAGEKEWDRLPDFVQEFLARDDLIKTGMKVTTELEGVYLTPFIDTEVLIKTMKRHDMFPDMTPTEKLDSGKCSMAWACFQIFGHMFKGVWIEGKEGDDESAEVTQKRKRYLDAFNLNMSDWESKPWLNSKIMYDWQRPLKWYQKQYLVNEAKGSMAVVLFYVKSCLERQVWLDTTTGESQEPNEYLFLRRKFAHMSEGTFDEVRENTSKACTKLDRAVAADTLQCRVINMAQPETFMPPEEDAVEWLEAHGQEDDVANNNDDATVERRRSDPGTSGGRAQERRWSDPGTSGGRAQECPTVNDHDEGDGDDEGTLKQQHYGRTYTLGSDIDNFYGPLPLGWLNKVDFVDRCARCPKCGCRDPAKTCTFPDGKRHHPVVEMVCNVKTFIPCNYPHCTNPQAHNILVCPTLHSRCPRCHIRGHNERQCQSRSKMMWATIFSNYARKGVYTQNWHRDVAWRGDNAIAAATANLGIITRDDGRQLFTEVGNDLATTNLKTLWDGACGRLHDNCLFQEYM